VVENVLEQFPAGIFQHHDDLLGGRYNRVELDDVGMAQQLQVLNLAFYTAGHVARDKLLTRDDLEGDLLAADFVYGQLHFAEGAFS